MPPVTQSERTRGTRLNGTTTHAGKAKCSLIVEVRGNNGSVAILRSASSTAAIGVLAFMIGSVALAATAQPAGCDWTHASALRAQGDRYRVQGQFGSAARAYIVAGNALRDCRTTSGMMLSARSLAQGGATLAQSGDYQNALSLLHSAQSRLQALFSVDAQTAEAARSCNDLVQTVISAINRIATFSM